MKLKGILSDRHFQTWPSWHIVYEWEDEICQVLDLPLIDSPRRNEDHKSFKIINSIPAIRRIKKALQNIKKALQNIVTFNSSSSLYFEMDPIYTEYFANTHKTIPVIVDFWDKKNIHLFQKAYRRCPYLLIPSLELLHYFKENNIQNRLIHFPVSLPSLYTLKPDRVFEKKYDILLAGRTSAVLIEYLKEYILTHPEIEYLHQIQLNEELYYVSNLRGNIGKFHSRTSYIYLLQSSRIAFYSTPGMDGGESRTNGFNPVTPRLFELLSAGCHVIARYPKNADTDFFQLDSICPSVNSYSDFENQLTKALHTPPPVKNNSDYLLKHYMARRIEILKSIK
jgi:hypothetical protein